MDSNNHCIAKSIFKKIITPQPFDYERDVDDIIKLIQDNFDTLVRVTDGESLSPQATENLFVQFRNNLKNNIPLGDVSSSHTVKPDTLRVIVIRGKNNVYGFITYFMYTDKTGFIQSIINYFTYTKNTGYIEALCVAKTRRNRGYARRLLEYAIQDLKEMGASGVRLTTGQENIPAQNLYKSVGFVALPITEENRENRSLTFEYIISKKQ